MDGLKASVSSFFEGDLQTILYGAGRIVLILVAAVILAYLVRRLARRLATRLAERRRTREEREEETGFRAGVLVERLTEGLTPAEKRERAAQRANTLGMFLGHVASIIIYAVAIMLVLGEIGINLGPILAGAGVAGIALGFGAQSLVRDFLSGIFIVVEDQYGVGDVVDVGEASGVVEEVSLRMTRLRSLDGTLWHVPNGEIRRAGNLSQNWARVVLDIPIAYDADLDAASSLILGAAQDTWQNQDTCMILEEPQVWGVEDFGADSIAIRLAAKTLPGQQWAVARALRAAVKHAMDGAGLEIPFPQRTVWLRERVQTN